MGLCSKAHIARAGWGDMPSVAIVGYGINGDPLHEGKLDLPELLEVPAPDEWAWAQEFIARRTWREAVIYRTVASDLSDLSDVKYDCIAFFSPSGISSLFINFPDFVQGGTRLAAFGPTTAKAVIDAGLILDIEAPHPNAPSMTGAIEAYIRRHTRSEADSKASKNDIAN